METVLTPRPGPRKRCEWRREAGCAPGMPTSGAQTPGVESGPGFCSSRKQRRPRHVHFARHPLFRHACARRWLARHDRHGSGSRRCRRPRDCHRRAQGPGQGPAGGDDGLRQRRDQSGAPSGRHPQHRRLQRGHAPVLGQIPRTGRRTHRPRDFQAGHAGRALPDRGPRRRLLPPEPRQGYRPEVPHARRLRGHPWHGVRRARRP